MELFKNPFPIPGERSTGDPYVMRYNGSYYFYATSFERKCVCGWKSDNLVDWGDYHVVCEEEQAIAAYAPEVHYVNGKFYMVASSGGNGHFIYEADEPFGPFKCITGRFGQRIDGTLFVDDDGSEYFLRAEKGGICGHRMPALDKVDIRPIQIPESNLGGWTEGPLVYHRDGYYYLTYTGNFLMSRGYRVDYSVSKESPVSGYVNMKNRTLLLEVDDEFHALGHSSSAMAADLDGAYIIYHNYNFLAEKPYRAVNVDRLFFNGARMYNNTCWWEQEKPQGPVGSWRGLKELAVEEDKAYFPLEPGEVYTAEFNLIPENGVSLYYGEGVIELTKSAVMAIEDGKTAAAASIPKNTAFDKNMTLRLARRGDGYMCLTLNNGQKLLSWSSLLPAGRIGLTADKVKEDRYFALSEHAFGSSDKVMRKAVPGRFDAIHALEDTEGVSVPENGMEVFAVKAQAGDRFTYPVNVRRDGTYGVAVMVRNAGDISFRVNAGDEEKELQATVKTLDCDGSVWITLGEVNLKGGMGEIAFTALQDVTVDSFRVFETEPVMEGYLIKDNELLMPMNIIGEKGQRSMISKEYGFSSSENPNFGYLGKNGWCDFRIRSKVHVLKSGSGFASFLLRATKESWHHFQVVDSVDAIEIRFDAQGVSIYRLDYDKKVLGTMAFDFDEAWLDVVCEIRKNTLTVSVDGMGTMMLELTDAPLCGRLGMRFDTESFGFGEVLLEAIE